MQKKTEQDLNRSRESNPEPTPEDYIQTLWPGLRAKSIAQFLDSDAAQDLVAQANDEELEGMKSNMAEHLDFVLSEILDGRTMAQIQGLDQGHLDAIYSVAQAKMGAGAVEDAASIFQLLIVLDPTVAKFYTGFGACQQLLKNYEYALQMYAIAQLQDLTDPRIPQNSAMCCVYLGRLDDARGLANRSMSMCQVALQSYESSSRVGIDEPAELRRLAQKSEQLLKLIAIRERNAIPVERKAKEQTH